MRRNFVRLLGLLPGVFLMLQLLSACNQNAKTGAGEEANVASVTKEQSAKLRAQQKWDAVVARDWKRAYDFLSPGMKKLRPFNRFSARMEGMPLKYKAAKVEKAECAGDACDVTVKIVYTYLGRIEAMRGMDSTSVIHEKWIKRENNWWFVPE